MGKGGEKAMSYSFHNFPKKYGMKDYGKTLDGVRQRYSSKDLVAIYDWGTPSVPGISDLDVLLVWKKDAKPLPLMKRAFAMLSTREKYVLYHPPMHISEGDFENVPFVYPEGTLGKVWGKTLKKKPLGKTEMREMNASVLNDIIVRHYPRDFLQQCMKKNIDVRSSLLRLNSMKYTFSTMRSLGIKTDASWKRFSDDVQVLRKSWFSAPDTKKLSILIEEALGISAQVIERCASYQEKRFPDVLDGLPGTIRFNGIKNNAVFIESWDKNKAMEEMKTLVKKGKATSILPKAYAAQMIHYAQEYGKISSHIKKHLHPMPMMKKSEHNALKKRIDVLNGQAELASQLRHSDFPAFFDFGYRSTKGINNALLRISDRLRF